MAPEALAFWQHLLEACLRTASWRQALEAQSWAPQHVSGAALDAYLRDEAVTMREGMQQLGLLPAKEGVEAS
jgi:tripartite-type tricarboxylate transporter receptor subunit TctC